MLHGIGVSHGIVRGVLYRETTFVPVISREEIALEGRPDQAQKYKNARQSAEEELQKLIDSLQAQGTDKAAILQRIRKYCWTRRWKRRYSKLSEKARARTVRWKMSTVPTQSASPAPKTP